VCGLRKTLLKATELKIVSCFIFGARFLEQEREKRRKSGLNFKHVACSVA
jgi:hypothetical protein